MSKTLNLTTEKIYEAKNVLDAILSKKLFPSFVANNLVTVQTKVDSLNKESKLLADQFSIETGHDMNGNTLYKNFIYISLDNNRTITPYLKDGEAIEYSEEVVKTIQESFTDDEKAEFEKFNITPSFIPYPVEPSKFKEFITEQNNFFSKENEIEFYELKNETVEKAELDGKLDDATEILIKLKLLGYYK
jgi:hypothetical protein